MWGQARPTLLTALGSSRQGLAGMAPPAEQQHTFPTLGASSGIPARAELSQALTNYVEQ